MFTFVSQTLLLWLKRMFGGNSSLCARCNSEEIRNRLNKGNGTNSSKIGAPPNESQAALE
jgi:hypothetical protein